MLQYKIPQNVGIEDRIVGPLTLRQLLILAGGFGISYVLFAILNKLYELNIIEYAVIALPGLLAVAFALIKINDIPLTKYLFLFLEFAIKPKKRVWDHRGISALVAPDLDEKLAEDTSEFEKNMAEKKARQASNLTELTRMLDSGGFENVRDVKHTDIDNTKDDDLVTEAYFGNKRKDSPTENMYWRTKDSQMKRLEMLASLPVTQLKKGTKETEIARQQIMNAKNEAESGNPKPANKAVITQKTVVQNNPTPKAVQKPQVIAPKPVTAKPIIKPVTQTKPVQTPKAQPQQKPAVNQIVQSQPVHKKRKRNRHHSKPVRDNNQVNTINKNQPAQYISDKPVNNKTAPQQKQNTKQQNTPSGKSGEFDFRELQKGEIQINLD